MISLACAAVSTAATAESAWSVSVHPVVPNLPVAVLAETHVVDSLLCTCTIEAVSGIGGSPEAKGRGSIRGCLGSRGWLCRVGYLVYSAGYVVCTEDFAQYEYLLHSKISLDTERVQRDDHHFMAALLMAVLICFSYHHPAGPLTVDQPACL